MKLSESEWEALSDCYDKGRAVWMGDGDPMKELTEKGLLEPCGQLGCKQAYAITKAGKKALELRHEFD